MGWLTRLRNGWFQLGRDLRLMLLTIAVVGISSGGIIAALFNPFGLLRLGYDARLIGRVNGAGWVTYGLLSVPAGLLVRRWGVRRTLTAGMTLWAVGMLLLSQGELVRSDRRVAWFLVTRVLASTGMAVFFPNYVAALIGMCNERIRDRVFAVEWSVLTLGGFAGSLAGGWLAGVTAVLAGSSLAQASPYRHTLALAALAMLLTVGALRAIRTIAAGGPQEQSQDREPAPYLPIGSFALFYMVMIVGVEGVVQWF